MLTQSDLKEMIHYDPDTGVFTWKVNRGTNKTKGKQCKSGHPKGYLTCHIDKKSYLLHRLAFLYMEGEFPKDGVDHINRDKKDNRWVNLKHATAAQNNANKGYRFAGVAWNSRLGKWRARAPRNEGSLGHFNTHYAACYARHVANLEKH